jgi:hypothetical protein
MNDRVPIELLQVNKLSYWLFLRRNTWLYHELNTEIINYLECIHSYRYDLGWILLMRTKLGSELDQNMKHYKSFLVLQFI